MKGINERNLLPIIRCAVTGSPEKVRTFIEAIRPLYAEFLTSGQRMDEYRGWAYDITFINEQSKEIDYQDLSRWSVANSSKDDFSFMYCNAVTIKVHLHDFLLM